MITQLYSQNLVLNPSFEEYNLQEVISGGMLSSFDGVDDWIYFNPPISSMQYFNSDFNDTLIAPPPPWDPLMSPIPSIGVPISWYGFQYPRTGNGIIGTAQSKFYREWVLFEFKESLIQNQDYCVSYYINLSQVSGKTHNNMGIYFSDDTTFFSVNYGYDITPQILSSKYFTDTLKWEIVEGIYTATGNEKYLTLGAFGQPDTFSYINNDLFSTFPSASENDETLFYFDDVSVYPCNAEVFVAECREDTSICLGDSVQIGTHDLEDYLYWWTPHEGIDSANSYSHVANPWVKPTETTTYYLTVKDFKFDESYDSVTITVNNCDVNTNAGTDKELLLIPNTFTPNGDNINDVFEYKTNEIDFDVTTAIFNRWGEEVFTFKGLSGWDGKGTPGGRYAYHITVVQNEITTEYSGIINLER
ncbi:MAG: gliding motility-associated C-terminal domain-containing protein [Flavobacteriales bacterium]|jgi:gliding motility-associated-like protein|nr:gliding motility-associated C-terminal domain-containing protein [Flavobacteriales bacterium]